MTRILLVEDDRTLVNLLAKQLNDHGYEVMSAEDGERGLELARSSQPNVCVFDVMLPKLDGLSLCKIVVKELGVPVILLTARGLEMDRVIGLDSGADDYIVKPFGLQELLARIRTVLRRTAQKKPNVLQVGQITIDLVSHRAFINAQALKLSYKEFELLALLVKNRGAVLTRDYLMSQVWGDDYEGDPRTLDVHIRWLRQKIETDADNPQLLQTVRGIGYRINDG
jgi:DNA-binding response OmpR family regulator